MEALEKAGNQFDYPFADIAAAYHIIPDSTLPLIVRGGKWGISEKLLEDLSFNPHAGIIAKKLQNYVVQVSRKDRATLLALGAAEIRREDEFGPQFVLLSNLSCYDDNAGLSLDNIDDLGTEMEF